MSFRPGRIALIATGGTISSLSGSDGAVATWTGEEILDAAGVDPSWIGPVLDVACVNGSDMTADLMREVAAASAESRSARASPG